MSARLEFRLLGGVAEVGADQWDRLLAPSDSPFLEWAFLAAVEAGSAAPDRAVLPRHATLWDGDRLVAALPLYVKGDGRGEFVYDWEWSAIAGRLGVRYYPKLVAMCPFTPVVGTRVLAESSLDATAVTRALAGAVEEWAREAGASGVHYLFLPEAEAARLDGGGRLRRLASHLVLENDGFRTFEDYLARFRSKDRTKIRRQRARMAEQGLAGAVVEGDRIGAEHLEAMWSFYRRTCDAHGTDSLYLQRSTWERLFETWRHRLVLSLAGKGGRWHGGALQVAKDGVLYGRYWGSRAYVPDLHFNLAFYQPIEHLIERGWRRYDVGWGNTYGKYARGLVPDPVWSVHRIFDPHLADAIGRRLEVERAHAAAEIEALRERAKLRPGAP